MNYPFSNFQYLVMFASNHQIYSKRFYNEYILVLRVRHEYHHQSHSNFQNVSSCDIVLVKDVNLPCLCWKKGRITKLVKGDDGLV